MSQAEPSIFDPSEEMDIFDEIDPEADERRRLLAEEDVAAGRLIPNERVIEWLKSLGTPNQLPRPSCDG